MGHRRGRGQILTADQLADKLAIPCAYILLGRAQAAFPESSTPGPSSYAMVILKRTPFQNHHTRLFPVIVDWRQWRDIIVPLLEDSRWSNYIGSLGGQTLGVGSATGTLGQAPSLGPGLFQDDLLEDWVLQIGNRIRLEAINGGYGSPTQEPLPEGSC